MTRTPALHYAAMLVTIVSEVTSTAMGTSYWHTSAAAASTPSRFLEAIRAAPWRGGLEPAADITHTKLEVSHGTVPDELVGTMYRNGPGRIRVGDTQYGHWFDGDGYIVAVEFNGCHTWPSMQARYVNTPRYRAQSVFPGKAGLATRGAWSSRGDGTLLSNLFRIPTNPANTNVITHANKLLALCEGGPPVPLDPATLATLPADADARSIRSFFAAHPKVCPSTKSLFGFGLQLPLLSGGLDIGWPPKLNLFELPPGSLHPVRQRAVPLPFFAFVHDAALTASKICIILPPWAVSLQDFIASSLGGEPLGRAYTFDRTKGTIVLIIDRSSLRISATAMLDGAPSLYHVINAHDDEDGRVVLQLAVLNGRREGLERNFADMYHAMWTTNEQCRAVEYVIQLAGPDEVQPGEGGAPELDEGINEEIRWAPRAVVLSQREVGGSMSKPFELPDVPPTQVGRKTRWAYVNCRSDNGESSGIQDAIGKLDLTASHYEHGGSLMATFDAGVASAPTFIPRPDPIAEDDGWVATFVYKPDEHRSDLVLLDATDLSTVCTMRLETHVPYMFHGSWCPTTHVGRQQQQPGS
eukprot:CAMPEP_0119317284 /NCGR_PEP_ID=MMETSP1333-20130426/42656_1 /TAXON_ID=418940 /ORGANISM="Scyphosphaera apsteinii, Strain RCC1455" /LENGTH=581 /DNA_ID=CAMNT_0007323179 /DNA_START=98 /DNA_END=1843 /DNA_ORIENTATION=+